MSLEFNLIAADMAVRATVELLHIGPDNRPHHSFLRTLRAAMCVPDLKEDIKKQDEVIKAAGAGKLERIMMWAAKARSAGCGNCGEHAAVAFMELLLRSCYPLDLVYIHGGDHNFVLIGREDGSSIEDPLTWGPETVVCDPYWGESYEASLYTCRRKDASRVRLYYRHSTPPVCE
jgi:hypothetical protein